jgi:hypothetical protein
VPWGLQKSEAALAELNPVSVSDCNVRELSSRASAEIYLRSGALGEFVMSGDKIGVNVRLDDVFDLPPVGGCGFKVDVDIPLGIDYRGHASRGDHVRGVGEATKVKAFDLHCFHDTVSGK